MFCMHCGAEVNADTVFCHACGTKVERVSPAVTSDYAAAPAVTSMDVKSVEPPLRSDASTLISCKTCSKSHSTLAATCPHCGAPNDWIHPKIQQLLTAKDQTGISQPFTFKYNKTEVWGETKKKRPWWVWLIAICFMPIVVGGGFFIAVVCAAICWFLLDLVFAKNYEFRANVANGIWKSNNDAFWQPVRAVLGV